MTANPNANNVKNEMHNPPANVNPIASSVIPEAGWSPRELDVVVGAIVEFSPLKTRPCSCGW